MRWTGQIFWLLAFDAYAASHLLPAFTAKISAIGPVGSRIQLQQRNCSRFSRDFLRRSTFSSSQRTGLRTSGLRLKVQDYLIKCQRCCQDSVVETSRGPQNETRTERFCITSFLQLRESDLLGLECFPKRRIAQLSFFFLRRSFFACSRVCCESAQASRTARRLQERMRWTGQIFWLLAFMTVNYRLTSPSSRLHPEILSAIGPMGSRIQLQQRNCSRFSRDFLRRSTFSSSQRTGTRTSGLRFERQDYLINCQRPASDADALQSFNDKNYNRIQA